MRLSKRIGSMQLSPIRKLIPYSEKAEKTGVHVYHLNIGQPDIGTPVEFFKGISSADVKVIKYTNSAGLLELREKFSRYFYELGVEVSPNEMIVTTGGSEAILFALSIVADRGDDVMIPEPFYANYNGFASMAGVNIIPITTYAENGFALPSMEEIIEKITPKTKAILLSNPSNPTGAVYEKDEMAKLVEIVKKRDLFLVVDEVYREFTFDGIELETVLKFEDALDRIILLDSASKRWSACGARIGLFVSKNKQVIEAAMKMAQSRLCAPALEQIGMMGLLDLSPEYMEKIRKEYERRRDCVYKELKKCSKIIVKKPKGAFYIVVKMPIDDSERFVKWMLTDFRWNGKTTMVAPLTGFYASKNKGKDEVRIAYVLKEDELRDAIRIFVMGLEEYLLYIHSVAHNIPKSNPSLIYRS